MLLCIGRITDGGGPGFFVFASFGFGVQCTTFWRRGDDEEDHLNRMTDIPDIYVPQDCANVYYGLLRV